MRRRIKNICVTNDKHVTANDFQLNDSLRHDNCAHTQPHPCVCVLPPPNAPRTNLTFGTPISELSCRMSQTRRRSLERMSANNNYHRHTPSLVWEGGGSGYRSGTKGDVRKVRKSVWPSLPLTFHRLHVAADLLDITTKQQLFRPTNQIHYQWQCPLPSPDSKTWRQ